MSYRPETVGTSAVPLVPFDSKRSSVAIHNNSTTATLYIADFPGVTSSNGYPILPGADFVLADYSGDDPTRSLWAIASALATNVRIYEGYRRS